MELPNPPYQKISFTYEEHSAAGNDVIFWAVDGNGNVVDEAAPENINGPVESVALAGRIYAVWMLHHDYYSQDCEPSCAEPHIGEIRACKT